MSGSRVVGGYVGVIDGVPVFETVIDGKGEMRTFKVFKSAGAALERWAHVCRVRVIVQDKPCERPASAGRLP